MIPTATAIRGRAESGEGVMNVDVNVGAGGGLPDGSELAAFEVPSEFASAIERLDGPQMKRSVELMGQCVQVRVRVSGAKECRRSSSLWNRQ